MTAHSPDIEICITNISYCEIVSCSQDMDSMRESPQSPNILLESSLEHVHTKRGVAMGGALTEAARRQLTSRSSNMVIRRALGT